MNEKQFTIIWVVLLVIILLAGGGAVWYLQFNLLEEQKAKLRQVKNAVADAESKKSKIKGLRDEIKQLQVKESELFQRIPNLTRAEYDDFADLLDSLRRQAGVTVSKATWVTPSRANPAPGKKGIPATVHKVQYDIQVGGTFYQLLRYINLLEQHRRFIGVENFSVGKGTGGSGDSPATGRKVSLRRDLKVTIYSYTYKPQNPKPFEIDQEEAKPSKSTDIPD